MVRLQRHSRDNNYPTETGGLRDWWPGGCVRDNVLNLAFTHDGTEQCFCVIEVIANDSELAYLSMKASRNGCETLDDVVGTIRDYIQQQRLARIPTVP